MIEKDELLFVVDENNNPIEPKPRFFVHQQKLWHRTTNIWIINKYRQILCQQRSLLKDKAPGLWEGFFGGHLPPQTDYLTGALQETNEELHLHLQENDLHLFTMHKAEPIKEFQAVYITQWHGDEKKLRFEKEEIQQITWLSLEDLKHILLVKKDPEWTFPGYFKTLYPELEITPVIS